MHSSWYSRRTTAGGCVGDGGDGGEDGDDEGTAGTAAFFLVLASREALLPTTQTGR